VRMGVGWSVCVHISTFSTSETDTCPSATTPATVAIRQRRLEGRQQ